MNCCRRKSFFILNQTKQIRQFHSSLNLFAGHSKWANIKHTKARNDDKRQKLFGKISTAISAAVRAGGLENNSGLQVALSRAKQYNVPKDRIDKALSAGEGGDADDLMFFEGSGPSGSAVLIECLSSSRNRTVQEVRHIFKQNGGSFGSKVQYLFDRRGVIDVELKSEDELETLMDCLMEVDFIDVQLLENNDNDENNDADDNVQAKESKPKAQIVCQVNELQKVKEHVATAFREPLGFDIIYKPNGELLELDDGGAGGDTPDESSPLAKFSNLIDALEDHQDVQRVFHNVH